MGIFHKPSNAHLGYPLHVHPRVLCDAGRCEQPPGIEEMAHQRGNFRMPGTHHNTVPTWSVSIGYSVPQMGLTQNGVILQMVLSYWNNCFSTIVFCFIFCSNFQTNPYWLGWRNSASFGQCPKFQLLDDCRGYERTWRQGFWNHLRTGNPSSNQDFMGPNPEKYHHNKLPQKSQY